MPREQNQIVDSLSKSFDFDDWKTSDAFYQYLSDIWGPYSVDSFAENFYKEVFTVSSE